MNKRFSTLFTASLLFSSVFGSNTWAQDVLKVGSIADKLETGKYYHLVMNDDNSEPDMALGFVGKSEQNETITVGAINARTTVEKTSEGVDADAYLWSIQEVNVSVTTTPKYALVLTNKKTGEVLRFNSSYEVETSITDDAKKASTDKIVWGATWAQYKAEARKVYVAAELEVKPTNAYAMGIDKGTNQFVHFSDSQYEKTFSIRVAAEEEVSDSELNDLYNSAGFNLKLDDKYKDVENPFDDSRIKAIDVDGVTVADGYSFPAGTYFAVSTPAGAYPTKENSGLKANELAAAQLAYLMDCEFIVVSPSLDNNISDSAAEQKEGRGFLFTTATGRSLNKYTETNKDKIDSSKQAGASEISVYNACFSVKKTASASGKYSIGLKNFRYEASAGTYAEKDNLIIDIAEKKYGSNTYLTTQTGTTAYIFTFVESNAVDPIELLNANGAAIYNIQFVSGTDDDTDELNKYLYAPAYYNSGKVNLYAKGAALTDTNMPEFQFVITNISGNDITFTSRANNSITFTAKLFEEEGGAYSLAISENSAHKKFDVLNIDEEGNVDVVATNSPTNSPELNLKWVKLTTPESTDKFNGTWNVVDESKVTMSFARDNTPTSNKLYPVIDEDGEFTTPTNDVIEAAQWQLVKSEKPAYITRSYAYVVGEGDDAEIKYVSLGDTTAYYTYNIQLIQDGEAVDKYLKNGQANPVAKSQNPTNYVIKDNVDGSVTIMSSYSDNKTLAFKASTNTSNTLEQLMVPANAGLNYSEFNETSKANYIKVYLLPEAPEVSWPGEEGHVSIQSELGNYISMNDDNDGIVVNNEEEVYYLNVTDKDAVVPSFYISKGVGTADRMFLFNPADSVNYYVAAGQFDREYQWAEDMTKAIFKAGQLNETSDTLTTEIKGKVAKVAMKADNAGTQAGLNFFKFQIIETEDGDGYYYIRQKNVGNKRYLANWSDKLTWEEKEKATLFRLEGVEAPTANEGVTTTDVKVIATDGAINIKNAAGKNVVISTILGQIIANEVLTSDNATISVPAGIAIVSVEGEEAVKVSVR